ncbi:helix-turn-helix transcriptional regulator [Polycladomyces sp. WAk]|uniref:Helix-turn-helix transcriptional regulator n=1 Tax=Polycladomyces zharkentensis TaxID=2807616 RepID=A0ABS2WI24_9BACL|nr:helix-turn-helix transcriptional regulator [Polycladomyces sp. WAk]MBN2909128.1 helix-turn-helix transcriptional regulator [Polycladomyces sp. WAk]
MSVGIVQREARMGAGVTQKELGRRLHLSRSMIAEIEAGRKRLPRDVAKKAVETLNCGFYALEVAAELTGIGIGKLDGDSIDLHRSALKEKSLEELQEAISQISATSLSRKPDRLDQMARNEISKVIEESMDAVVVLMNFIASICQEYGFSWNDVWQKERRKLEAKGYKKAR